MACYFQEMKRLGQKGPFTSRWQGDEGQGDEGQGGRVSQQGGLRHGRFVHAWHLAWLWPAPSSGTRCSQIQGPCARAVRAAGTVVPEQFVGLAGQPGRQVRSVPVAGCTGKGESSGPPALSTLVRPRRSKRVVGDPASPLLLSAVRHAPLGLLLGLLVHAAAEKVVVGFLLELVLQAELVLLRRLLRGRGEPGLLHGTRAQAL